MKRQTSHPLITLILIVSLVLIVSGCSPAAPVTVVVTEIVDGEELEVVVGQDNDGGNSADREVEETEEAVEAESDAFAATSTSGGAGEAPSGADEHSGDPNAPFPLPTQVAEAPPIVPADEEFQSLQAGEVDDNEDFEAYLQYVIDFQSFLGYPSESLDVTERHIIRVINRDGLPVLGAQVMVYDGQNLVASITTPATGLAYFFPRAYPSHANASEFVVAVQRGNRSEEFSLTRQNVDAVWDVTLDVSATQAPVKLDVMFLIDATGSMGDEIDELKNNLLSISAQVAALPSNPDVRFGMVHYRDRGDQYVTQITDFTSDVQDFQQDLMDVRAAAGGDTPEALNEALWNAIHDVNWRDGETVRLVFVVADAPPHLDYPQDYSYAESLMDAAAAGIKLHPIASRLCEHRDTCSADTRAYQEQAEYIFRQMAQFTGGHYLFLTYEDTPQANSGEPGTESHVSEDQFSVEDLDALVIRLIQEELEALSGGQ